jgi:hypothetical protein
MALDFPALRDRVQLNCHIADARHGGNYSLCVYLLKMREYYRWEKGYRISDQLPRQEIGEWLSAREALWESVAEEDYAALRIDGRDYDPFESEAINAALQPYELVYSGGLGSVGAPHFFLGALHRAETHGDVTLLVSGKEYARDLTAPPAMTQGQIIYVRRESLRRSLWEQVDSWSWSKPRNAMARALEAFDVDSDLDAALDAMMEHQLHTVLLHEMGEIQVGERLGPAWREMLVRLPHSKAELGARAVKDHLADCVTTLPALLEADEPGALHLYFANLTNMRKALFPALGKAYARWVEGGDREPLTAAVAAGREHWLALAQGILALYATHGEGAVAHIEALIEAGVLESVDPSPQAPG